MRVFISVDLPEECTKYLATIQKKIIDSGLFAGKFIEPQQLHATLVFIGDVNEEMFTHIKIALTTIRMLPFKICFGQLGVLPTKNQIRIIWVNLLGEELPVLAHEIKAILEPIITLPTRPFLSHVTLARVKKVCDNEKLFSFLESLEIKPISFTVNEFVLKESVLSDEGVEHKVIERYALNNL